MALTNLDLTLPGLGSSPGELVAENKYPYPSFELPSGTVTVRTNLYRYSNAETGATTGWAGVTSATISSSTDQARSGTHSYKVVCPGGAVNEGIGASPSTNSTSSGASGAETHSVWVYAPLGATLRLLLEEYTTASAWVANRGELFFTGTGAWQRVSVTGAKGTAANVMRVFVGTRVAPQAITFYVDDALGEVGSTLNDFFDGNTTDAGDFEYVWSGTANASTSIMRAKGLEGVSDPGVYQSQEWAAEGTHSAFVPTGKTLTVALAEASTVKVVARHTGQTMVGSTGVEIRRNLLQRPKPTSGLSTTNNPNGWTLLRDVVGAVTVYDDNAPEVVGVTGLEGLTSAAKIALGSTGTGTARAAGFYPGGYGSATGAKHADELVISVTPNVSYVFKAVAAINEDMTGWSAQSGIRVIGSWLDASGTFISTTSAIIQKGPANTPFVVTETRSAPEGAAFLRLRADIRVDSADDTTGVIAWCYAIWADRAETAGDYIDGNTLPSASGYPVWAGTDNASETILYAATTDTATGADATLEVQATGHVALLEGYWDLLTIVPGVYTGPPFTGSSNYTGYSAAWTGTPDESTSTLSYAPLASPLGDIVSWSITEPTTPHNIHRRNGSTGTASVTAKAREDTYWTISEDANITVDGLQGTFVGTINQSQISPFQEHGEPSGGVTFSIESVLNQLNAERTLAPVVNEPLSDVVATYVAAVAPTLTVTWLASANPTKTYSAWSGNVWDILKTLCAANNIEMALNGSTLLIRDLGTNIVRFDSPQNPGFDIENASLSITPGSGQFVEITYRDSVAIDNQASYNYVDNPSVEINATGYGVRTTAFGAISGSRVTN